MMSEDEMGVYEDLPLPDTWCTRDLQLAQRIP